MNVDLSMTEMSEIVDTLNTALMLGEFETINQWLRDEDPANMSIDASVVYMRTTYMARDKLPDWQNFVYRARDAFNAKGHDGDHICSGLLPK